MPASTRIIGRAQTTAAAGAIVALGASYSPAQRVLVALFLCLRWSTGVLGELLLCHIPLLFGDNGRAGHAACRVERAGKPLA